MFTHAIGGPQSTLCRLANTGPVVGEEGHLSYAVAVSDPQAHIVSYLLIQNLASCGSSAAVFLTPCSGRRESSKVFSGQHMEGQGFQWPSTLWMHNPLSLREKLGCDCVSLCTVRTAYSERGRAAHVFVFSTGYGDGGQRGE